MIMSHKTRNYFEIQKTSIMLLRYVSFYLLGISSGIYLFHIYDDCSIGIDPTEPLSSSSPSVVSNVPQSHDILNYLVHIETAHPDNVQFPSDINQKTVICAGLLIDGLYVLTTGHCVTGNQRSPSRLKTSDLTVYLNHPGCRPSVHPINIRNHPNYLWGVGYLEHDLGLLTLPSATCDTKYTPVSLPDYVKITTERPVPRPGTNVTFLQWRHAQPKSLIQTVLSQGECVWRSTCRKQEANDSVLCTQFAAGTIQLGDSGGPILTTTDSGKFVMEGVLSYTSDDKNRTCRHGQVAVYARISQYLQWIGQAMKEDKELLHSPAFGSTISSDSGASDTILDTENTAECPHQAPVVSHVGLGLQAWLIVGIGLCGVCLVLLTVKNTLTTCAWTHSRETPVPVSDEMTSLF